MSGASLFFIHDVMLFRSTDAALDDTDKKQSLYLQQLLDYSELGINPAFKWHKSKIVFDWRASIRLWIAGPQWDWY